MAWESKGRRRSAGQQVTFRERLRGTFWGWVDKKNTAERRAQAVDSLTAYGSEFNAPGALLTVSPGSDLKIWLSLDLSAGAERSSYDELATRLSTALASAGLRLLSSMVPDAQDTISRLAQGEALHVESSR